MTRILSAAQGAMPMNKPITRSWLLLGRWSILLALATVSVIPLSAQSVGGTLVEKTTDRPIQGARILLVAEGGTEVSSTLTSAAGGFLLRAPDPGPYRLRAERIGFESHTSDPFTLAAGQPLTYHLSVPVRAISLRGVTAGGERRCRLRPAEGLMTHRVWEEARKALALTAWAEEARVFRYGLELFERTLDPSDLRVTEERVRSRAGYHAQPFVSVEAEQLEKRGFVHEADGGEFYDFYAPDAAVLLSDAFLDTHCLRVVEGKGEREGFVGLAFEPVRRRDVPEIQGTFWLDEGTSLLETLEYQYVNLPWPIPLGEVGGRVEFASLPNGAVVVRRWRIRMPVLALERMVFPGRINESYRLDRLREEGGEVVRVRSSGGEIIELAERATLVGSVTDSTSGAPLGGALVELIGTPYSGKTDTAGRFRIDALPPGRYTATFSHPRLDSLPLAVAPEREVELRVGQTMRVAFAVPPLHRLAQAACPTLTSGQVSDGTTSGAVVGEEMGIAHGTVWDSTGAAVAGAEVQMRWSRWSVNTHQRGGVGSSPRAARGHRASRGSVTATEEASWTADAVTDQSGRYVVCGVPVGVPIRAQVRFGESASGEVTFELEDAVRVQDLVLDKVRSREPIRSLLPLPDSAEYALPEVRVKVLSDSSIRARAETSTGAMWLGPDQIQVLRDRGATRIADLLQRHRLGGLTVKPMLRNYQQVGVCVEVVRRSPTSSSGCRMVTLVLDGAIMDPSEAARMLDAMALDAVETVEYIPPRDAVTRFGFRGEHGAVVVTTRR